MMDLPEYFFRVRENGAAVFRVSTDPQSGRVEMDEIAMANVRNGTIRPHGDRVLSATDHKAIQAWMEDRQALQARRDLDDIHRTIDHLNQTAHWASSRATDAELADVTDRLLLSMHDLRAVLVRRKAKAQAARKP